MSVVSHTDSQTLSTVGGRVVRVMRVTDKHGDSLTMKTDDDEGFTFHTKDFLRVSEGVREDAERYS